MFGWFKKRKAYNMGRDIGATITDELEEYIKLRVLPAGERFVAVFEGQLKTIHGDPEHDAKTLAGAEWKIFQDNLADFAGEMKAELSIMTYKHDEVIEAGGVRDVIDEYITERIGMIVGDMKEKAAGLALAAIGETAAPETAAKG
jgi:hypothetical protein